MIFKSICLKEGLCSRTIDFTDHVNLIYSDKNTQGKTTLIRFILYGLGYSIPNTKRIAFDRCEVVLTIIANEKTYRIKRNCLDYLEVDIDKEITTYVLPDEHKVFLSLIFNTDNDDILDNILGACYLDQEKGWTLLNRGTVIGSIRFQIESLIRGLSNIDCKDLIKKERIIENDLSKYKQLLNVAEYRESLINSNDRLISFDYNSDILASIDRLEIEKNSLKRELRRIDQTLSDNQAFKRFIGEIKLLVRSPSGEDIQVNDSNIVYLDDSIDYLIARKKYVVSGISKIDSEIGNLEQNLNSDLEESAQISLYNEESYYQQANAALKNVNIDSAIINNQIKQYQKELKDIRKEISELTKANNAVAPIVYETMLGYYEDLELGEKDSVSESYLFTSNLKELSGAVLSKTVFAFRLAYIKAIESVINVKLPIILDSPKGKEVDDYNVDLMMNLLKRDFSNHQIIIASIYHYDFQDYNLIEIKDKLINNQIAEH